MRLKTVTLTAILLGSVAVAPAFADSTHTCQGNADCSSDTNNTTNNNTTNQGGQGGHGVGVGVGIGIGGEGGKGGAGGAGGAGGEGGKGYGGAGGEGGNAQQQQGQQQGQIQGQGQHQSSRNRNDNTNVNANLNANRNSNRNANTNVNANLNDNSNSNNATQSVNTYNERAPVSTAYAAPLTAGEDTCMGSSSIGGQAVGFGLTLGTTWTDDNCQRLKNSRELGRLGYTKASVALICINEDVQTAMAAAGTPCPYKREQDASYEREEPTRVAHNDYATTAEDVTPVAKPAPAPKPEYRFVPMSPIAD